MLMAPLAVSHDCGVGLRRIQDKLRLLLVKHITSYVAVFNSDTCPMVVHPIMGRLTHQHGLLLHCLVLLVLRGRLYHVTWMICIHT